MNDKVNRDTIVIHEVERLLDVGITNKDEIISMVIQNTGIAKPIIRRIIRDMRNEMKRKIKILQADQILPPD